MGQGVGVIEPGLPALNDGAIELAAEQRAGRWAGAEARLLEYLSAMGVKDPAEMDRLSQQVLQRVEIRSVVSELVDPVEAVIEEALRSLDQWLASELGPEADADLICAARAAALGGLVPGWSSRWAGISDESLDSQLRAACIFPVPPKAPLMMKPNTIHRCCHKLRRRIVAFFRLFVGRAGEQRSIAGGRS